MKKWLAPICACLILGLVAVGCGGGDDDSSNGSAATSDTATTTQPAGVGANKPKAAAEKATAVEIVDIDFKPKDITVPKGTTVKWTNTGQLPHTVTKESGPGGSFDSGSLSPDDTFEQKFDAPGKYDYICQIHAGQRGSVTVK